MSKGRVLVIDDDEWVCRLLAVAMKEAGFEITITENAADGFFKAVEEQPDCIVCDVDLPDHNGYWVAKKIRSHPSKIATAPFVFLSGLDDREHRLEGFQVGGDAYLTKPFRIDEVVAQVDALIQMAARLNKGRASLASIPPAGAAMTGDLAQMSVGTLLTLVDLERRSGKLLLRSAGKRAEFTIEAGNVASTTLDGKTVPPLDAIRTAMHWITGKFSLVPTEHPATPNEASLPINGLLMEAARLEDEARAVENRPSSAPLASWKESIARSSPRPNHATPLPPVLTPSAPPSEEGGSLSIFPVEPPPISAPPISAPPISAEPVSIAPISIDPVSLAPLSVDVSMDSITGPAETHEPTPTTAVPPVVETPRLKETPPKEASVTMPSMTPPVATAPSKPALGTPLPAPRPFSPSKPTPASGTPRSGAFVPRLKSSTTQPSMPAISAPTKSPTFGPRPTPSPFKATQPSGSKPPKPALPVPKTGFAGAMRSLSPAHGVRAVTPPVGMPKGTPPEPEVAAPEVAEPKVAEPTPPAEDAPKIPPPPESLDSGWSNPPPADDDK